ncbi:hypothetical protein L5515_008042 [Caenorhabditis briggsae]|uniref:Uncharacterized protein n=1 Tax=Caenorhabditis briggsae TaxID=6238 RepID=A0AAE9F6A6_CAEBR|nr:hypothetical protein L5515_008042 [Caenorhabditis briggsae]
MCKDNRSTERNNWIFPDGTLPDGIAIYGTFRHFSKIDPTSSRKFGNVTTHDGFGSISPGLYYFSFNHSEKYQ